ncbi:predicted protein [Sclerotinia sclerotiorum 1980 UF-70]|uniref:Uncharacterized protein n=1 Tax=Sclerotinia sclerotiorum (strain ATCC 18683 / 1980 / Ss-1) TaxID=665079 RepID=A7F142_SCLS1|nr:predicted protein [Sclerotinia sclerotiorum 1980 UF-70]EDN95434.1 predicted protein [Sclerotinia sclerotiorum 1980 UF-70]
MEHEKGILQDVLVYESKRKRENGNVVILNMETLVFEKMDGEVLLFWVDIWVRHKDDQRWRNPLASLMRLETSRLQAGEASSKEIIHCCISGGEER